MWFPIQRTHLIALTVLTVLISSLGELAGQEGYRFRSGIELINVTATVTDRSGRFVADLNEPDFTVYDDDQRVSITNFSKERVPLSLGIVVDTSGSMAGEKIAHARAAIERLLDQLGPGDEVFLTSFSSDVELQQPWTTSVEAVREKLRGLSTNGGTAIYDAVVQAVPVAQEARHQKKVVVLMSDGNDTTSDADISTVRNIVRKTEVIVYAIAIDGEMDRGHRSDRLNVSVLKEITDASGGRTEVVRESRDLNDATQDIANELGNQYSLAYASPEHRDGRWHVIRVQVRDSSMTVRARRGYLARSPLLVVRREDSRRAILGKRDHVKRLRLHAGDFHARRADRHSGNADTGDRRTFLEQPLDVGHRHMPLDDIATDQCRMAGADLARHPVLVLQLVDGFSVGGPHREASGLQVIDPLAAAATGRTLVDLDARRL